MTAHFTGFGTDTSIKGGGVKLVNTHNDSPTNLYISS
jgi:hypothetical protein